MGQRYLYIGQYFHKRGKKLTDLTEKKIGIASNINQREFNLNSTKFTIGAVITAAWVGDDKEIAKHEKALQSILDHDCLEGEWFEDADDDLYDRISDYMKVHGIPEYSLEKIEQENKEEAIEIQKKNKKREENKHLLVGERFSVRRFGYENEVEVRRN